MNEERYEKISKWLREDEKRLKTFVIIYKLLPYLVVSAYGIVIGYEILFGTEKDRIRVLAVPAAAFLLCTLFRKFINEKRPYEALRINPIIKKDKKGQSFPSRHLVSAGVIAMSAWYVNKMFGAVMVGIGILLGIIRPMAGVHYIKDVIAGFVMGILCGIIGFFIF